ncbi:MAG: Holliday junction branch migration protein RuvA [Sphingobacteriales bacterium]|nr:MAG: Holliday junction branch migration protein RuvA [Sphingobacteriales bacterium]
MIGYVKGVLQQLSPAQTFVDINGLGYEVNITLHTYEQIKEMKGAVLLYTHLQVREDAWVLYGFATLEEKDAFQKLLSVSGIGSATARILLSSLTAVDLARIIANGDSKTLEKVKGIGGKTAQRIILELKDKLTVTIPDLESGALPAAPLIEQDALTALLGLGIPKANAESAIKKSMKAETDDYSVEELIKAALKNL